MAGSAEMQKLIRALVEHPDKAARFLKDPTGTAKTLGFVLGRSEATLIQDAIKDLKIGTRSASDDYIDFPECGHIESSPPSGSLAKVARQCALDAMKQVGSKGRLKR